MNKYDFINDKITFTNLILRTFIIAIIVLIAIIVPFNIATYFLIQSSIKDEAGDEKKIHNIILTDFKTLQSVISSDIKILRDDYLFENFLNDSSQHNKELLSVRFTQFMKDKNYYTQLRYIDHNGMEIIRINQNSNETTLVPQKDLQNKSNRYYFNELIQLDPNDLYISDIDLNMEKGQIVEPIQPMIRVGSKIESKDGLVQGVLVLNHESEPLIQSFMKLNEIETGHKHYIINTEGNYLFHEDSDKTWGQFYQTRTNFQDDFPNTLEKLDPSKPYVITKEGIFIYSYVSNFTDLAKPSTIFIAEIPARNYSLFSFPQLTLSIIIWIALTTIIFLLYNQRRLQSYISRIISIIYHGIDQNPVVAVLTDSKGKIIYVNSAFENVTGYTFNDVYGKNPSILKSGDMSDETYKNLWQTIMKGNSWDGEFHNKCKDGSYYWAEARISAIFNKHGKVDHFLALQNNITEKKEILRKYYDLALKDPLTGAFNRNIYALEENKESIANILVKNTSMVYMIDIDHFKLINDEYGHSVGDEILEKIVEHLKKHIRDNDLIIRFGGEEFLLILSIVSLTSGTEFGERIRKYFEDTPITTSAGEVSIRISIGMTKVHVNNEDIDVVIKRVDKALYQAKNTGRNKLVYGE